MKSLKSVKPENIEQNPPFSLVFSNVIFMINNEPIYFLKCSHNLKDKAKI
jgi:hypothetical protein